MKFNWTPLWTYCDEHLPSDIIATLLTGKSYTFTRYNEVTHRASPYPIRKEIVWNLYDIDTKAFPSGLLGKVIRKLEERSIEYSVDTLNNPPNKIYDFSLHFKGYLTRKNREVRYFQNEATDEIVKYSSGLIVIGTGGGKTMFYANTINRLGVKSLILTIDLTSREQTCREIGEMLGNENVTTIDQDDYYKSPIVVANIQNCWAKLKDPKFSAYVKGVNLLIINECHHLNESKMVKKVDLGNTWYAIAQMIPAWYRIGATGTPPEEGTLANLLLESVVGDTLYRKSTQELIEEGFATPIKVHVYSWDSNNTEVNSATKAYDNMISAPDFISNITNIAKYYAYKGNKVIIFCDWVDKQLIPLEKALGDLVAVVHGKIKAKDRPAIIQQFIDGDKLILMGTVFSEDFDLPSIDVGIILGKKKNERAVKQRTGRAARLFEGKERGIIVIPFIQDYKPRTSYGKQKFVDGMLASHSKQGIEILKAEGHDIEYRNLESLIREVKLIEASGH